MIDTKKFARRPFFVDAVQVTSENVEDVAEWCMGEVRTTEQTAEEKYVKVRVLRPLTERQTKAFVGDWVLYAGTGFKVYTPKAFEKSFEPLGTHEVKLTKAEADEAGFKPAIESVALAHRDATTGKFVSSQYVKDNPDTTVSETDYNKGV